MIILDQLKAFISNAFYTIRSSLKQGQKFMVDQQSFGAFLEDAVKAKLREDPNAVIAVTPPFLLFTETARAIFKNHAYYMGFPVIDVIIAPCGENTARPIFKYIVRINLKFVDPEVIRRLFPDRDFPQLQRRHSVGIE